MAEPTSVIALDYDEEATGPAPYMATALVTYPVTVPVFETGMALGQLQIRWDRDVEYQQVAFTSKFQRLLLEGLHAGKAPDGWSDAIFSGASLTVLKVLSNRTKLDIGQLRTFIRNYGHTKMSVRRKTLANIIALLENTSAVLAEFKHFDATNRMVAMRKEVTEAIAEADTFRRNRGPIIDGSEMFLAGKNLDDKEVIANLDDEADEFDEEEFKRQYEEDVTRGLEVARRDIEKKKAEFEDRKRRMRAESAKARNGDEDGEKKKRKTH